MKITLTVLILLFLIVETKAQPIKSSKIFSIVENLKQNKLNNADELLRLQGFNLITDLQPYTDENEMFVNHFKSFRRVTSEMATTIEYKIKRNSNDIVFMEFTLSAKSPKNMLGSVELFRQFHNYCISQCNGCELNDNKGKVSVHLNYLYPIKAVGGYLPIKDGTIDLSVGPKVSRFYVNTENYDLFRKDGYARYDYVESDSEFAFGITTISYGGAQNSSNEIRIPLSSTNGMNSLNIKIGGKTQEYLIDSGASFLTISKSNYEFLKEIGVIRQSDIKEKITVKIADGSLKTYQSIIIPSIDISGFKVQNIKTLVTEGDNLLGQSVLGQFSNWRIDNSKNQLIIEK